MDDDNVPEFEEVVVGQDGFRKRVYNIIAGIIIIMNLLMILQKKDPILLTLTTPSSFDLADTFLTDDFEDERFFCPKNYGGTLGKNNCDRRIFRRSYPQIRTAFLGYVSWT